MGSTPTSGRVICKELRHPSHLHSHLSLRKTGRDLRIGTEAAQTLRLSRNGLLRLVARGELRAIRYARTGKRAAKIVIREKDVLDFLDENTIGNFQDGHKGR